MALATLTSRVEENDKIAFDEFCSSVGLSASAAINMYVKVVVRDKRIPFEIEQSEPLRDTASSSKVEYASKEAALASASKMMERFDDAFKELAK